MQSRMIFLLATILSLALASAPQFRKKAPPPEEKTACGAIVPPGQRNVELARRRAISAKAALPPTDAPYYLPLTIHLAHRSNGAGGLTLDELEATMRRLNQKMQQVGGENFFARSQSNDKHFSSNSVFSIVFSNF